MKCVIQVPASRLSYLLLIKPTPHTCRDILRVMSVQKNFEHDQRTAKRKVETVEAENKKLVKKRGGARKKKVYVDGRA